MHTQAMALLPRLQQSDATAQAEFCERFEPYIRREVRLRLRMDERLCRVLDSLDVCQEVLKSFLLRSAAGEYHVESAGQLWGLLKRMLKNKLSKQRRWHYAKRRSLKRTEGRDTPVLQELPSHTPSVSYILANREWLDSLLDQLSDEERTIALLRADGQSWLQIAERLTKSPDALRMQLARALDGALAIFPE